MLRRLNWFLVSVLLGVGSLSAARPPKAYTLPMVRLDSLIVSQLNGGDARFQEYRYAYELLGSEVLGLDVRIDSLGLEHAILARYSEPEFAKLVSDTERRYEGVVLNEIHREVERALKSLHKLRPTMPVPTRLYTHVSGLTQRVVVAVGLLSISLDYYLGSSYPVYLEHFTPWQCQLSTSERVAYDAVLGWIVSEMPEPRDKVITLESRLRYWGEIYRLMHKLFPRATEAELFGFTKEQHAWLKSNYKLIVQNARDRGEFSSPSPVVIDKYFTELPEGVALPSEGPRLIVIGPWLGYKLYR